MNLKRMLLLLALSAAISAVAGPQKVKTSVEKVTLFIDGAQVTRTARWTSRPEIDGRIHRPVALSG